MRFAVALAAMLLAAPALAGPLPMDAPIVLGNVETVCTGIGEGKNDPRWKSYPVRVEFADSQAHYLAGAHVVLADAAGAVAAEFDCSGAWVLLRMPRGLYAVSARIGMASATERFQTPATGQLRVIVRFPSL
ncbi:MAG TPA: hypothetical protein VG889_03270 [Rhizomicrobium sp.]|nr:hypothetical protein [Rhizomicrobium sp.]